MIPNEETLLHDLTVDEASSTLRATAYLFEKSAAATADNSAREALLDYAKCYREMAELRDQNDAEVDDGPIRRKRQRSPLLSVRHKPWPEPPRPSLQMGFVRFRLW